MFEGTKVALADLRVELEDGTKLPADALTWTPNDTYTGVEIANGYVLAYREAAEFEIVEIEGTYLDFRHSWWKLIQTTPPYPIPIQKKTAVLSAVFLYCFYLI